LRQVASLGAANTGAPAEAGRPYAELWLGTHPSGPAQLPGASLLRWSCGFALTRHPASVFHAAAGGATLKAWLAEGPADRLGAAVAARWGGDLPFLLKVRAKQALAFA
jgi:mannose-6-phosphate isomerase